MFVTSTVVVCIFADQELTTRQHLDDKLTDHLNHFQQDFENVLKEMNGVLDEFGAEKEAERLARMQSYQEFRDIPKTFVSTDRIHFLR